ncbi:prolipoprotein diacylglyceryl transferase [Paenibacillus antri]|uniref:Phosphatidylglycerol--prolipoprotein diacylglyceryl transferase n=1 Tax=Paenibacillus antri TaxID=2582848 RepID=A0A5R9FZ65_9BACL|nr:prolipoprotein diacylglyceryl transferase [Paenibacillus antri]TLS49357.1 prolipoprotein diacylglyceryl transferase [Paenibacillus antri]
MIHSLALDPIAFAIGPLTVHWYGIILGTAALVGLALAVREGKRFGIIPDFFMDLLLIGVPSSVIAARLYYVAFRWQDYKDDPIAIFKIWEGGIAIYGALIGALIAGFLYIRHKGYSFWRIADICAPSLIAGQAIGRWGNFVNQEAYGSPVTEGFLRDALHLPNFIVNQMYIDEVYRHPTFLYESVWNVAGLLLLFGLRRLPIVRSGELLLGYFIWYSIGRFFIEGLRTDSLAFTGPKWLENLLESLWSPMLLLAPPGKMDYGNIRISQLLAVLLVIGAIALIVYRRAAGFAKERYSDPIVSTKASASGTATASAGAPEAADPAEEQATTEERRERKEPHDPNGTV